MFTFEIMKNLFIILSTIVFTIGLTSSGCSNDTKNDDLGKFVTEDAIFNEIKKEHEGISKDDVCIDQIKDFKTLFILGFFAHDRGCGNNQYYYKGHLIELTDKDIQSILVDNGFQENKNVTVEKFNKDVINHLNYVQTTLPENFDTVNYEFYPPKVWEEDNQIISSVWVKRPGGMMPEDRFHLSVLIMDSEGVKLSHSIKNKFTVPYN